MIKYDTDELSGAEDARDDNIFSTEQEIHETDNIQDTELEMHEMDDFQDAQHETDVFHDAQQQIHDTDDFQDAELEMHEMDDFQDAQQEIHETDDFHDAQQEIHDTDDLQDAEQEIHDTDDYQEYEYDYLEERCDLEDITKYNKGGFHPVHINDILNDRFEVIHKLGSGGFGTVWLCRDCSAEKWRALKILTANHSSRTSENKIFEFLERSSSREELEKNHITIPLESFWIDGPNGRHICQVMEIHGYPVDEWRHERDSIFPSTRKDSTELCRQMTEALDFLHSKGICHGDFRPSNILMKIDQAALHKLDVQQMLELVGEADAYTVYTTSGKDPRPKGPQYCVIPVIRSWCVKLLVPEIVVVDFGESFFLSDPSHGTGIPMLYAAPEIIFRQAAGTGVDIWSLACTVFEIRTGEQLFPGDFFGPNERSVVHDIEIAIGPLAAPYRERWDRERLGELASTVSSAETELTLPEEESTLPEAELRLPEAGLTCELALTEEEPTFHEDESTLIEDEWRFPENGWALIEEEPPLPEDESTFIEDESTLIEEETNINSRTPATCSLAAWELERKVEIGESGYDDVLEAKLGAERVQYPPAIGEHMFDPPEKYRYEREEVLALADLLKKLLKYLPHERLDAHSALQHEWLQEAQASQD